MHAHRLLSMRTNGGQMRTFGGRPSVAWFLCRVAPTSQSDHAFSRDDAADEASCKCEPLVHDMTKHESDHEQYKQSPRQSSPDPPSA